MVRFQYSCLRVGRMPKAEGTDVQTAVRLWVLFAVVAVDIVVVFALVDCRACRGYK